MLISGIVKVHLGECSGCHLHPALIRGVHLQVVTVGAVESEEPRPGQRGILPLTPGVHAPEGPPQLLGLSLSNRGQLPSPLEDQQQLGGLGI